MAIRTLLTLTTALRDRQATLQRCMQPSPRSNTAGHSIGSTTRPRQSLKKLVGLTKIVLSGPARAWTGRGTAERDGRLIAVLYHAARGLPAYQCGVAGSVAHLLLWRVAAPALRSWLFTRTGTTPERLVA